MIDETLMPEFRATLTTGGYNMLFGSGISLSSRNRRNQPLVSASRLSERLCTVTGVRPGTPLQRVTSLLTPEQVVSELVDPYSGCRPSDALQQLPRYVWKRMFTFNIDDVVESVYGASSGKQRLVALNFDSDFEPSTDDKSEVILVHLHGSV